MTMKIRVHPIQTGSIQLHKEHYEGKGNMLFWMLFTNNWTESLPINAFLIEHPRGILLFDTGENPKIKQQDFFPKWVPGHRMAIIHISGSLILVPTPGHTYGHQSLLIYGDHPLCLTGDAVLTYNHYKGLLPDGIATYKIAARKTILKLREWSNENNGAPIIPSHDPDMKKYLSK